MKSRSLVFFLLSTLSSCGVFSQQSTPGADPFNICRSALINDYNRLNDSQDRFQLYSIMAMDEGLRCQELDNIMSGSAYFLKRFGDDVSCKATNNREIVDLGADDAKDLRDKYEPVRDVLCRGVDRVSQIGKIEPAPTPQDLSECEKRFFEDQEKVRIALLEFVDPSIRREATPPRVFSNLAYCREAVVAEEIARYFNDKYGQGFVCDRSADQGDQVIGDRYARLAEALAERIYLMRCDKCAKDPDDKRLPAAGCFGLVWDPTKRK